MKEMFFEDDIDDSKYCGHLYGLGTNFVVNKNNNSSSASLASQTSSATTTTSSTTTTYNPNCKVLKPLVFLKYHHEEDHFSKSPAR